MAVITILNRGQRIAGRLEAATSCRRAPILPAHLHTLREIQLPNTRARIGFSVPPRCLL
jgi:hypothetical protein